MRFWGVLKYFALVVALALFGLSISGIIMFIDLQFKKIKKTQKEE